MSGLNLHAHLERSTVRLSTPVEAQRIVSEIKAIFTVEEVHLAQVEEIPARPVTVLAFVGFIAWLSLMIGAFLYDFVVAIVTYALTTWVPIITIPVILSMAGPRSAWVRMYQRYIVLRTMNNSEILAPSDVQSKNDTKIILKEGLKRIELEFANSEEAARVFGMIEKLGHKIT